MTPALNPWEVDCTISPQGRPAFDQIITGEATCPAKAYDAAGEEARRVNGKHTHVIVHDCVYAQRREDGDSA